jgi:hypothetical protein
MPFPAWVTPIERYWVNSREHRSIMDAISQIPAKLAVLLAPPIYGGGNPMDATWFPEVATNAREFVLSVRAKIQGPEDVDGLLEAYLLMVVSGMAVGHTILPLSQDKASGQRWAVDGVYYRSVIGSREVHAAGLLFRGLSGEVRHRVVNDFKGRIKPNEVFQEVVFHGVRDPLNPQEHYWSHESIGKLPSVFVSQLAQLILWLSGPRNLTIQRGATGGYRDIDFLLRAVGQHPSTEQETKLKRDVTLNWLWSKQETWRNFAGDPEKGTSLYGVVGRSIENDFIDALAEQKEYPIAETALEFVQRDELASRSKKKPSLSQIEGDESEDSFRSNWYSRSAFSPITSRRLEQIEKPAHSPGEVVEIETSLLPDETKKPPRGREPAKAVVGWLEGVRLRHEFIERVQVKHDIENAFRSVYGAGRSPAADQSHHGRLNGIALRDFRVFMVRDICGERWETVGAVLNISGREVAAAKKNLGRSRGEICEWLRDRYPQRRRPATPLAQCSQKDPKPWRAERCRPDFLAGRQLQRVEISHDWNGTGNPEPSYAGGARIAM